MKKTFVIIILSLIFILTAWTLYIKIFLPAYVSTTVSCNPEKFNELYSDKYVVGGTFEVMESEIGIETEISYPEENIPIKMHELTHQKQYEKGRLYGCDKIVGHYLNEVEAYTVQNLYDIFF